MDLRRGRRVQNEVQVLGSTGSSGIHQSTDASQSHLTGFRGQFRALGGSGVSNTDLSVVNDGDVGSSPTPAVTGFPPGVVNNGILYAVADPATAQAQSDLITAYTAAQIAPGTPGPADLGGATLEPGVYTYASTAPWTAGTLTLDGLPIRCAMDCPGVSESACGSGRDLLRPRGGRRREMRGGPSSARRASSDERRPSDELSVRCLAA
jgi:hypothetical protein